MAPEPADFGGPVPVPVIDRAANRRRVLDELDVAFCLTWGCAEANLRQQPVPGDVRDYVIWERRRALEWLMGDDWDNPNYDT